ncbi:ABC transporter ATP-binding protein [Achromobacter sp. GG226]|uniref:ABC transporter ATP-binding protein n=1 Tax=Verticiella alkaliphila TaxID=2779529 RepID=UPI001C0D9D7E|nr:ABC transporter ATP-binding protein [Verticiella sp. GG226]MBU4610616.1 ABC transporter ATP-binding protein [Verticiella sp. GG226]
MLDIQSLTLAYGSQPVVQDFSLRLADGEIGCLLGASGCGKTTVLRAIAGFEAPRAGEIHLAGERVAAVGVMQPPEARRVGVVFQDYALFPHLTVAENVGFGLPRSGQRRERIRDMLALVGLADAGERYPHELSGGQQQRVALARALAPAPRLMLMDEPFSNLDVTLRERLAEEVRAILKQAGATAVLVTHDQREAFAVADRVGVMAHGRLRQWDTPYALYHRPADRFVASFIGEGVMLPATPLADSRLASELGPFAPLAAVADAGRGLDVLIRPDALALHAREGLQARVVHRAFRGADFLYTLELPSGERVLALAPSRQPYAVGELVGVSLTADQAAVFQRAA